MQEGIQKNKTHTLILVSLIALLTTLVFKLGHPDVPAPRHPESQVPQSEKDNQEMGPRAPRTEVSHIAQLQPSTLHHHSIHLRPIG